MSTRHAYIRRARHWISNRGWRGLADHLLWQVRLLAKGKPLSGEAGPETGAHPFDMSYGVDTTGLIWGESLSSGKGEEQAQYWATGYYGIAPSVFDSALDRLSLRWQNFTFVDIGCGKGRALLLALRRPFREVIGVELSPALAAVAQDNLARFRASWRQASVPARVLAADATSFDFPAGPLLLYLYHPFAAPVMRRFLAHLRAAAETEKRPVYLLYTNPELASLLDAEPHLRRLFDACFDLSAEEAVADRFGSHGERIIAYGPAFEVAPPSSTAA